MHCINVGVKACASMASALILSLVLCSGVTWAATTWNFDMQPGYGDIQTGYTRIRGSDTKGAGSYGWDFVTNSAQSVFTGHPMEDLLEDRCWGSADRTFSANVDNGSYDVRLYFRHADATPVTNESVYAEGSSSPIYTIASLAGGVIEISGPLRVNVSDGILDLRFSDDDASSKVWMVSGVDINPAPGAPALSRKGVILFLVLLSGLILMAMRRPGRNRIP